ncbi:hypothetical protein BKA21_001770 [Cellulomonas oligotrophica]|uniref:Uncharacterized protein n=1 Tax=Cellulomonas oligotrophica TaxID=931536 RepID=A0A7Y9FHV6_9CELL|nr:hypothetical protein [Cellulomonas oligotrophica]NYD86221.1 hypothetical protein [Cellulomonas oligotrophica]
MRRLLQIVQACRADTFDGARADADDDVPAFCVREGDERYGEVAGRDPPGLALEPLALGQLGEVSNGGIDVLRESMVGIGVPHACTATVLQLFALEVPVRTACTQTPTRIA